MRYAASNGSNTCMALRIGPLSAVLRGYNFGGSGLRVAVLPGYSFFCARI